MRVLPQRLFARAGTSQPCKEVKLQSALQSHACQDGRGSRCDVRRREENPLPWSGGTSMAWRCDRFGVVGGAEGAGVLRGILGTNQGEGEGKGDDNRGGVTDRWGRGTSRRPGRPSWPPPLPQTSSSMLRPPRWVTVAASAPSAELIEVVASSVAAPRSSP
jgi:hypothetical protein